MPGWGISSKSRRCSSSKNLGEVDSNPHHPLTAPSHSEQFRVDPLFTLSKFSGAAEFPERPHVTQNNPTAARRVDIV